MKEAIDFFGILLAAVFAAATQHPSTSTSADMAFTFMAVFLFGTVLYWRR